MLYNSSVCNTSSRTLDLFGNLEKLNYKHPPYSVHYPELLTIEGDHPCMAVGNDISGNTYCHSKSMGQMKPIEFINVNATTVASWYSTMSNNVEKC